MPTQSKRKSLSKKIRFEVFKRDKFTCQYCGKVAPNVVLEVDHIKPVAIGGLNDILNLITSCNDCNGGKSDRQLSDDSVVAKQRTQLEMLQERREQIELMFEWRKGLDKLDEDKSKMLVSYIESKIDSYNLRDSGVSKVIALTKKYDLADILESVDLSATKYLRHGAEGKLTQESVEEFFNKITGILVIKNRPPIERKLSYIKGICRNRFSYWSPQAGAIVLNNYVNALRNQGWSDEQVLKDLEGEVELKTKELRNWSEWKALLEGWTEDIKGWGAQANDEKAADNENKEEELESDELQGYAEDLVRDKADIVPALEYIGKVFQNYSDADLNPCIDKFVLDYLLALSEYFNSEGSDELKKPTIYRAIHSSGFSKLFSPIDSVLTMQLESCVYEILKSYISSIDALTEANVNPNTYGFLYDNYRSLIGLSYT